MKMKEVRSLPDNGYWFYFNETRDYEYMEASDFKYLVKLQRPKKRKITLQKYKYSHDKSGVVNNLLSYLRPIRDEADREVQYLMWWLNAKE